MVSRAWALAGVLALAAGCSGTSGRPGGGDGATCGDSQCASTESQASCCVDCGCPSGQTCQSGQCKAPTTPVCGDTVCGSGENQSNCCNDCGCPSGQQCNTTTKKCGAGAAVCGDSTCADSESRTTCCDDCGCGAGLTCNTTTHKCGTGGSAFCGDANCDTGETQDNCCQDCGCPTDQTCGAGGACTGGAGTTPAGGPCTQDTDCAGEEPYCDTDQPGGYCMSNCDAGVTDCGAGAFCLDTDYGGICLAGECTTTADCARKGEGYICDTDKSCWYYPPYEVVNPGGAKMGDGCTDDAQCESGLCVTAEYDGHPTGFPGGYCTVECRQALTNSCPAESTCAEVRAFGATMCMVNCSGDNDCRQGYKCSGGTCQPPVTPPTGKPGSSCTQDSDCTGTDAFCATDLFNGYCIVPGCTQDSDCGAGSFCLSLGSGNYCVEGKCGQDSDCSRVAEGYFCDTDFSCWHG